MVETILVHPHAVKAPECARLHLSINHSKITLIVKNLTTKHSKNISIIVGYYQILLCMAYVETLFNSEAGIQGEKLLLNSKLGTCGDVFEKKSFWAPRQMY